MKLARFARPVLSAVLPAVLVASCGYHAAYGGAEPAYRLTVAAAPLAVPYPEALQEALVGTRAALGEAGALRTGSETPRLVVEVLRVDEVASGIAASPGPTGTVPLGRASAVGVTVQAWVEDGTGARSRETGDIRRVQTVGQGGESPSNAATFEEAVRAAAREAGAGAARRVLGIADLSVEPM